MSTCSIMGKRISKMSLHWSGSGSILKRKVFLCNRTVFKSRLITRLNSNFANQTKRMLRNHQFERRICVGVHVRFVDVVDLMRCHVNQICCCLSIRKENPELCSIFWGRKFLIQLDKHMFKSNTNLTCRLSPFSFSLAPSLSIYIFCVDHRFLYVHLIIRSIAILSNEHEKLVRLWTTLWN